MVRMKELKTIIVTRKTLDVTVPRQRRVLIESREAERAGPGNFTLDPLQDLSDPHRAVHEANIMESVKAI